MSLSLESARVLHAGKFHVGSTALGRARGLQQIVKTFRKFNFSKYFPPGKRGLYSVERLLGDGPHVRRMNSGLIKAAKEQDSNLIFLEKGLLIYPETIEALRRLPARPLLVHYSPDDQMNSNNVSRHYRATMELFDVHITTKPFNLVELKELGAKRVILQRVGFDPGLHRILPDSAEGRRDFGASVSFAGAYEDARGKSIQSLERGEFDVRVWGPGWRRSGIVNTSNITIEGRGVWGEDYVAVINFSKINICFLRKVNRDVSTSRSVEIPASGGFMLGERTEEHLSMFEEGVEAQFFESDDELFEKIRYYLAHDDERQRIAVAGHKRVHNEFSYVNVMRDTFFQLADLYA